MRTSARTIAALLLAGVAGAGCLTVGPPPVAYVLPVQEFELASGLRVAIERADTAGTIGVALVVDTGWADDPAGAPGVAHLVEHLMLRAPDATGVSLDSRLASLGTAGTNGFTTLDRTIFCTFAPRSALEELVDALGTRLADPLLGADGALLAKEQMVIREELELRRGAASTTGVGLVPAALAPPAHPLAHLHDNLETAFGPQVSLDIARAFVARHYRPERMTLVISGAIPPELGRRLVGTLPPALLGRAADPRAAMRRPLAKADLAPNPGLGLQTHPADVRTPELWMAWLLPPVLGTDNTTFEVLGDMVSRVLNNLVNDGYLPDVLSVETSTILSTQGGALICRLVLCPSADAGSIQKRVGENVAALSSLNFPFAAGGTGAGLAYQSALRATVLPTALSMQDIARRTMVRAKLLHDDAGAPLSKVMDSLEAITPDLVSNLAYRHLREEQARAVLLVPSGPRVGAPLLSIRPPRSNDATAGEESGADSSSEEDDTSQVGDLLAVAHAPGVGGVLTTRLPNGLTLIALRRPGLPFASMVLGFHADPQPGESPAAADAVLFARRHPFVEGALQRGLSQRIDRDHDSYREGLSMFATKVGAAFDLLADEARNLSVRWPNKAFERWLESTTLAVGTPAERADRAFSSALWGNHVYALRLDREAAAKLTAKQIYAWLDRIRRPANGALMIVGDVDPREMTQMAAERLGDWHGDPIPPPIPVSTRGPDLSVVLTEDPRRPSVDIHFGCFLPPVRGSKDTVAGGVLREVLDDELLRRLRLELGISYAPSVRMNFLRGGTFVLEGHLDVGPSELPRALEVLRGWLGTNGPLPETHTFERARWRIARRSGLAYSTNDALARGLFATWNMGLPLASLDQFPQALASVTPADLTAALAACRASAVVSVMGRGPLPAATGE